MVKKTPTKKVTAKPKEEEKKIVIPRLKLKVVKITIEGTSPLLVNRFDEKSKQEIEDKARKRAKPKKEFDSPEVQYKNSLYMMPGKKKRYGMPTSGLKKCAVTACRFIDGVPMTIAKGSFHVIDEPGNDGLTEIKGTPEMDSRIVRVGNFGNKKPCTRHRGIFKKWSVTFPVEYNERVISDEQILHLYENAGFAIGLCEYRPEKDGNLGRFRVARG